MCSEVTTQKYVWIYLFTEIVDLLNEWKPFVGIWMSCSRSINLLYDDEKSLKSELKFFDKWIDFNKSVFVSIVTNYVAVNIQPLFIKRASKLCFIDFIF